RHTRSLRDWSSDVCSSDLGGSLAVDNIDRLFEEMALGLEIPPAKSLKPQRRLFEETIYVIDGQGAAAVWHREDRKQTFEWQKGSLFSPPLNTCYQLFNGSGSQPARYLAVTTAPTMINLLHNHDFIFNNNFTFTDRF